jgi:hypothetical protein
LDIVVEKSPDAEVGTNKMLEKMKDSVIELKRDVKRTPSKRKNLYKLK